MRSAIDRITRERVWAGDARGGGLYICECCDAPVHLVRAETVHFAHRRGRARPDCEQYFPSDIRFSGRPQRPLLSERSEGVPLSYLAFDMSVNGPELAVYLPPSIGPEWSGSVRLVAGSTRTLGYAHLRDGMRIPFRLHDGQWTLSVIGEVADEYLGKLTLGRQSLEQERNLFYAATSTGRRIELTESVRLGQSFWWIRREQMMTLDSLLSRVTVDLQWQGSGWRVYLITLPAVATHDEMGAISQWMQRRVRPSRPSVWVGSPCARQVLPDGTEVFALTDGPLTWRANKPVNFRLIQHGSDIAVVEVFDATEVVWERPEAGRWHVEVDEVRAASIQIVPTPPAYSAAVVCEIDGGPTFDVAQLQSYVDSQRENGALSIRGKLRYQTPAVGELLNLSESTWRSGLLEQQFRLSPGLNISAGNFGSACWPESPLREASGEKRGEQMPLARWLAGVGRLEAQASDIRLSVPFSLRSRSPIYEQLARLAWPLRFAAQVRHLQSILEGHE